MSYLNNNDNDLNISPRWASFKRIWYFVAIALLLSLLALWLLGYGPGKERQCGVNVAATSASGEKLAAVAGATALPSLNLKGLGLTSGDSGALRIPVGSSFSDAGANAYDAAGNRVAVDVSGEVDTTTAGEYLLTYTATDAAGNVTSKTRTVIVEAAAMVAMPTLTLKGSPDVEIAQGEKYVDAGATAVNGAGDAISVDVKGEVDTHTVGEYLLTYTATDKDSNTSSVARHVRVNATADATQPVIKLNGSSLVKISAGDSFTDKGATAEDKEDGELSVKVTGEVDYKTAGEYLLTYTATDKAGNSASTTRKVIVTESIAKEVAKEASQEAMAGQHPRARLYFGFDQFTPAHDRKDELSGVLKVLHSNANTKAYLSGYHDPKGNILYNTYLASQRAKTVRSLLRKEGISADRMVTEAPTETEGTGSPREARRVEIMVR